MHYRNKREELYPPSPCAQIRVYMSAKVPDTFIDERHSYCESCDTYKKGVQWWTMSS